jgi:Na+/H+ antiporter NhaA
VVGLLAKCFVRLGWLLFYQLVCAGMHTCIADSMVGLLIPVQCVTKGIRCRDKIYSIKRMVAVCCDMMKG